MNETIILATLKQFKCVPVHTKSEIIHKSEETIPYGFLLNARVDDKTLTLCKDTIGLTPEQMNNTFHKSWGKVKDTPQEQLWFEQILHYITTYGFKELSIYNKDTIFIPCEKLEIPELKDDFSITIIKGLTRDDLHKAIMEVLSTGIALKEETIKDYLTILKYVGFSQEDLGTIKNKEMVILLCDEFDIIPEKPVEFLRYVIYSITNSTLLIKDKTTIEAIKANKSNIPYKLFKKVDLVRISTIFNRFKPLFLAFKTDIRLVPYINKLSKLSKTHHKPMPEDYLNMVTSSNALILPRVKEELEKVNIFRKIRLLYALNIRMQEPDGLLYRIRNGKSYIKSTVPYEVDKKYFKTIYKIVLNSIVEQLKVKDKKVFIPKGINYTLPSTEKQFTGEFPLGTSITLDKDMLVGINWKDFNGNVDLDLSTISMHGKIGWNSVHKSSDLKILFSGDITDSGRGATEVFYIEKGIREPLLLINNVYSGDLNVPFKIFVAKYKPKDLHKNYTVNPNHMVLKVETEMKYKQKILGIIMPTKKGKIKFVLAENSTRGNISIDNKITNMTRDYLYEFYTSAISLKKVLKQAGAIFVDQEHAEIDLSPEKVTKNDFINLLTSK